MPGSKDRKSPSRRPFLARDPIVGFVVIEVAPGPTYPVPRVVAVFRERSELGGRMIEDEWQHTSRLLTTKVAPRCSDKERQIRLKLHLHVQPRFG